MAILQARSVRKRANCCGSPPTCFLEQGYEAVSVEADRPASGRTKTNVYKHFGGKAELFAAAVEALCHELVRSINPGRSGRS